MVTFETIRKKAEARKNGEQALKDLMPEVKGPGELKEIPDDRWLSEMTKRIFQAGFNWQVIENKWDGFEAAFHGFDPGRLSILSDDDNDEYLKDKRIVRNGQKIATVRHNGGMVVDLAKEHGTAAACFADWPEKDFIGLLDMLKKRGSRLGGSTAGIFLRYMGKDSFILTKDVTAALIAAGVVDKAPSSKKDMARVQDAFNNWRAESAWPLSHISRTLALSVGD